ncbi:CBS domain-containing protein [Nodosilinea sp. LEGE 07088]|uniref:CBS domain-containing protein n=1 Tax=Nodosilinea sp. LEGE 07088 TaxID=2777968 RepID=UPI0018829FEF|nr:CBS domain-containing protein [Nodosilinea sp. LEGE 07088]MBE9137089.1 CBS domain-containing protein [Nodosilinea sp. LEGE 07088]
MLTVRDIMTKPVVVIRSSATVQNAILLMRAKRLRSLIVEPTEETPYGIVTEKDIVFKVIARRKNPDFVRVHDIMRQPCIRISAHATVLEAAQVLADAGIHRAPVMENDELLGIVSVTDILRKGHPDSPPRDELAKRIQDALQHTRIIDDEEAQMRQDCDLAWQIFEEMHQSSKVTV